MSVDDMDTGIAEIEQAAQDFIARIVAAEVDYVVNELGEDTLTEITEALAGLIIVDPRDLVSIINEATQLLAQYVIYTTPEFKVKAEAKGIDFSHAPLVVNHDKFPSE